MSTEAEVVNVGAVVPKALSDSLRDMAKARERSVAAEIRLALKAWVDEHADDVKPSAAKGAA
jgi:hypothetical protein